MQICLIPLTLCPPPPPPPRARFLSPTELGTISKPDFHTYTTGKRYRYLMHMLYFMPIGDNFSPNNPLHKYHKIERFHPHTVPGKARH